MWLLMCCDSFVKIGKVGVKTIHLSSLPQFIYLFGRAELKFDSALPYEQLSVIT